VSSTLEKNKKLTAALDKKHISKSNLVAALKKKPWEAILLRIIARQKP